MTALLVDDEITVREGLRVLIDWKAYGFDTLEEGMDGSDGLEKMLRLKPELTLLDIKMPKLSGIEAAEEARKAGYAGKIVILSGYSDFKYAQSAIRIGVDAYLLKPIDEDELAEAVKKAGKRPAQAASAGCPAENDRASANADVVPRMLRHMEMHYGQDLTLEALAALFGYNSAYLGKVFKGRTGDSFNTRLDKIRIRNAKILLSDGKLKVYEICERTGYGSLDYFYKKFKACTGRSPSEYRRQTEPASPSSAAPCSRRV